MQSDRVYYKIAKKKKINKKKLVAPSAEEDVPVLLFWKS